MTKSVLFSSLGKKYMMALTGLFLCFFLVGHLLGNLQLLISDMGEARDSFNVYAQFMTTNPVVKVLSWLTYISILVHAIDGIALTIQNNKARPIGYANNKPSKNSSWISRSMAPLGILLLFYIISHMAHFWWKMHFEDMPVYEFEGEQIKDLYTVTVLFFQNSLIWTLVYIVSMLVLAFHLAHGVGSAMQSLGLRFGKLKKLIEIKAIGFAVIIPLAFAFIPFYIHFILNSIEEWQF